MPNPPRPHAVRTLARQPHPPGIYAPKYDAELAAWICARLAAGESLRSICRADKAMPTEKTVWNWARSHPDFRAAKEVAMMLQRQAILARHEARIAAKAARWAERAAVSTDGRSRIRYASGYSAEIADAICARLCVGETLQSVCRDPAMPCVATVYNWLRANRDFRAAYAWAKEVAFDYIVEIAAEAAPWLGNGAESMRALAKIEAQAHRRCAQIAPTTYASGPYGVERRDREV